MSDIVERLRRVGSERQRTTAHDTPDHYLHVVAKISNADGLLMTEAADRIAQLEAELAEQVQWVKDLADSLMEAEGKIGVKNARIAQLEAALREIVNSARVYTTGEGHARCAQIAYAALGEERT